MTAIEWTDRTLNAFVGCRRVSEGCRACYAERFVHRKMSPQHRGLTVMGNKGPRWNGEVSYAPHRFDEMLRATKPQRWFINSLSDLFFEPVSFETIAALLGMMAVAHQKHGHVAQILTKRPARAVEFFRWLREEYPDPRAVYQVAMGWFVGGAPDHLRVRSEAWKRAVAEVLDVEDPFPFWLGVSVEDQATADERIPLLLQCPAALRWVSYEPALGPVDFRLMGTQPGTWTNGRPVTLRDLLGWIVVGGESGPGARSFDVEWARSTIEQCRDAGVPVFVKQLGAKPQATADPRGVGWTTTTGVRLRDRKGGDPSEWPRDVRVREMPEVQGA